MKIAIVINTTWNIYNFRMGLLKSLQNDGHEIHAISPTDAYVPHLAKAGITHHHVTISAHGSNPIKDSVLLMDFIRLYWKINPDVILHYTIKPNIYGSLAAAILRIPVINNVSGLGSAFHHKTITYYMVQTLYKLAFIKAEKIFFQNDEDRIFFVKNRLVRWAKTGLLPGSGINLRKFLPVEYQNGSPFTFLMVARLISDKGIFEYVEAIRHLRKKGCNAKFQLLGGFDSKPDRAVKPEMVETWVKEGLVEYLGVSDHVMEIMSKAHCVVLPSYREGTPRVLLEAASLCKPMVATDVPGCHHIVKDGFNGLLCKPMDAIDLAEKMQSILNFSEATLRAMGINGRQYVQDKFDENKVIDKYKQAIGKLSGSQQLKPVVQLQ